MIKLARYAVDAIKLSNPAGNLIFPADMIKSLLPFIFIPEEAENQINASLAKHFIEIAMQDYRNRPFDINANYIEDFVWQLPSHVWITAFKLAYQAGVNEGKRGGKL